MKTEEILDPAGTSRAVIDRHELSAVGAHVLRTGWTGWDEPARLGAWKRPGCPSFAGRKKGRTRGALTNAAGVDLRAR